LADVAGSLSAKLASLGHDVFLFLPLYHEARSWAGKARRTLTIDVPFGPETRSLSVALVEKENLRVAFVDDSAFFDRPGVYGENGVDYGDNDRRFSLFCRAVLEAAKALEFAPEVVHAHDWQAGLLPILLKRLYAGDPVLGAAHSVFTVHNMAYQGLFPAAAVQLSGLGLKELSPSSLEFYGKASFLKAGLVFADRLTTVSPNYAREIQESSETGCGMEGILRQRSHVLSGILNGLDVDYWNPEKDPNLPKPYGAATVFQGGKAAAKKALRQECGLKVDSGLPLIGIVSRLDRQKGLDIAIAALERRLGGFELAVLGSGDPALAVSIRQYASRHPSRIYFREGFDESFAHRLYAASDIFLMPSRFEPCGLGQMIAMRYGAVVVGSRVGGLADTVFEADSGIGNGFLAEPGDIGSLERALDRALEAYHGPMWPKLVEHGMRTDFSWDRSARAYVDLYENLVGAVVGPKA
jgi:starch synthase